MDVLKYRGDMDEKTVNAVQHASAILGHTNAHGRALRKMLEGWQDYAKAHAQRYSEPGEERYTIGDDGTLGPYWAEVGLAIKRLLDGDTGGLDCGSIAGNILEAIEAEGFKTDGYTLTD
jgi:hypothetical protein